MRAFVDSILCALGVHDWHYINVAGFSERRVCNRCSQRQEKLDE